MSSPVTAPIAQAAPVPFGVVAATGETRPPFVAPALDKVAGDPAAVKARAANEQVLAVVPTIDAKNLASAGWGIVFPTGIDTAVKKALQPLLDLRQKQVNDPGLFKIFEGTSGVKPNQSAVGWLDHQGTSLAVVDPANGVPYYLLLVGTPQQISFEFQFVLDTQWCVGRICFDTPAEYAAYAQAVVDYESTKTLPHKKTAAMWMPHNSGDAATGMLLNQVGQPFVQKGLGKYALSSYVDQKATKQQLNDIFLGKAECGQPAVLFTGSHGLEWAMSDVPGQRANQGALITQEWMPGTAVGAGDCFSAADVTVDCKVQGMMYFLFACFGGGCPATDTYQRDANGGPLQIASEPMLSKLPQKLLTKGALAVMAHVDRAWNWSFQAGSGMPQNQVIKSTIEGVMLGLRAGQAADYFNYQWSTLAALLGVLQGQAAANPVSSAGLANLMVARDDARNYMLFGDPAARLRVEEMK